jgi:hypothetical protein
LLNAVQFYLQGQQVSPADAAPPEEGKESRVESRPPSPCHPLPTLRLTLRRRRTFSLPALPGWHHRRC